MIAVLSSSIAGIAYDDARATLDVHFRNGATYRYFAVPRTVYEQLLAARSKGAYVNANVRDRFDFERIAPAQNVTSSAGTRRPR